MNHKITLINPPQLNVLDDRQYPPIGLLYIASAVRKEGYGVNVVDLASRQKNQWEELIDEGSDIYGIISFTPAIGHVKQITEICGRKNPNCLVVVGGPHASAVPQSTLNFTKCDAVAIGEGEHSFVKFLQQYFNTGKYEPIIPNTPVLNLDKLDFPARDLVDHHTYTATLFGKKTAPIISARGCPYICSFCDKGVFGSKMRFRGVKNVLTELHEIKQTYGYQSVWFYDDIFTVNVQRLNLLLRGIKELEIQFLCDGRVNLMNFELLKNLKEAGCVKIAYGIESGSQKVLDLNNKQTTVQQCIDAIQAAKDAGIFVKCYFIFGLPGETEQTVEQTKQLIEKANPDQANLYTFQPYPGSDIWNRPEHYGIEIINQDFNNYFMISTDGTGGINYRLKNLTEQKYIELRDDMISFIRSRNINRPENTSNI